MKKFAKRLVYLAVFALAFVLGLWLLLARPIFPPKTVDVDVNLYIDEQLLYQHVKVLSIDYLPRDYQNLENLNASADYIVSQLRQMGLETEEQIFKVNGSGFRNIISSFGPTEGEKIIIGAHYDVAGAHPGADDNASGVAGLIELARLLKNTELQKNVTLVFYTLEEPPFFASGSMGSYVHAKSERDNHADIVLMISLEMIGYYSDEPDSQMFPLSLLGLFYPDKGNFITVVDRVFSPWAKKVKKAMMAHSSLPVYSLNAPTFVPGVDFSDHKNYWNQGYDAVMITNTAFYRNTAYHTDEDTIDRLDFKKMSAVVKAVFGFVINLSK